MRKVWINNTTCSKMVLLPLDIKSKRCFFFPPHKFYNVGERSQPAADEAIFLFTLAKVKLSSSQKWFGSSFAQGTHSYFVTLHHIFSHFSPFCDLQLAAELEEQVPAWLIFPWCVVCCLGLLLLPKSNLSLCWVSIVLLACCDITDRSRDFLRSCKRRVMS